MKRLIAEEEYRFYSKLETARKYNRHKPEVVKAVKEKQKALLERCY